MLAFLAWILGEGIARVLGISLVYALRISFNLMLGIPIALAQIADRFKSKTAEWLCDAYMFACTWGLVLLLVVGAAVVVWKMFQAKPDEAAAPVLKLRFGLSIASIAPARRTTISRAIALPRTARTAADHVADFRSS